MPSSFTYVHCNVQRASGKFGELRLTGLQKHLKDLDPPADFVFLQETKDAPYVLDGYEHVHTTSNPKVLSDGSTGSSQLNIQVYQRRRGTYTAVNAMDEMVDDQKRKCLYFDVAKNGKRLGVPVRVYHANSSMGGGINAVNHAFSKAESAPQSLHVGDFNCNLNALRQRVEGGLADESVFDRIAAPANADGSFKATHRSGSALDYTVHGDRVQVEYGDPRVTSFGHPKESTNTYATRDAPDDQRKDPIDHYIMTATATVLDAAPFRSPVASSRAAARLISIRDFVHALSVDLNAAPRKGATVVKRDAAQLLSLVGQIAGRNAPILTPKQNRRLTTLTGRIRRGADKIAARLGGRTAVLPARKKRGVFDKKLALRVKTR